MNNRRNGFSRLSRVTDRIANKLINNNLELSGVQSDCFRMLRKVNDYGDSKTTEIEAVDLVHVQFETGFEDVPIEYTKMPDGSMVGTVLELKDENALVVNIPSDQYVKKGDLIIKVLETDRESHSLVIFPFTVVEELANFGNSSIVSKKYKIAQYSSPIEPGTINALRQIAEARMEVDF